MKLAVSTMTTNRHFVKALRRQQHWLEELKVRVSDVSPKDCPHEALLLCFVDKPVESFRVVPGNPDVFEVECGIDSSSNYLADDDVLLIQMLEAKLKQMIQECSSLGDDRKTLLDIVEAWTTDAIMQC